MSSLHEDNHATISKETSEQDNSPGLTSNEIEALVVDALLSKDAATRKMAIQTLEEAFDCLPDSLQTVVRQMSDASQSQGEAVLSYSGKASAAIVKAEGPAPLQEWSRFGGDTADDEWRNKLIFGDNLGVLASLVQMKQAGLLKNEDGTDGIRVCYIDPPFATEREFTGKNGITAYKDKVRGADFVEFLRRRLILIHSLLADNGTLWLHLDTKKSHYAKVILDEIFGEGCFQSEVAWKSDYAKGHKSSRRPLRQHDSILMYTKSPSPTSWVWNPQFTDYDPDYIRKNYKSDDGDGRGLYQKITLQSPSGSPYNYVYKGYSPPAKGWVCPETTMELWDAEGRIWFPPNKNNLLRRKLFLSEMSGVPLQDLWLDINHLQKPTYPTEKPEALLARVIRASSNEGDLVLDCFAGSGSTLRAAESLGRRWIGVDCGKLSIHTATRDLLTTTGPDKEPVKPFTVFHAGLYDEQRLAELDYDSWVNFVRQLFGFSNKSETRNGIDFQGRSDSSTLVHVVDTSASEDDTTQCITEQYLQSLVDTVKPGKRTSLQVVVPPQSVRNSQTLRTFYELKAVGSDHTTKVSVRQVSASITGDFLALGQPRSEDAVNAIIKVHGFNLAVAPDVDLDVKTVYKKPVIDVKDFVSWSLVTETNTGSPSSDDPRSDLALVFVDYDFHEDTFDFEKCLYGSDLASAKGKTPWRIELEDEALNSRTAVTFVDRFGNEERRIFSPEDFSS